jgi:hypothetical protein
VHNDQIAGEKGIDVATNQIVRMPMMKVKNFILRVRMKFWINLPAFPIGKFDRRVHGFPPSAGDV